MTQDDRYTLGSGNIYADLGFEEPDLEKTKATLARQIGTIITSRNLTQVEAAGILGIDQPKVSALLRGRLGGFSIERLLRFLTRLDQDVKIVVHPKTTNHISGGIAVLASSTDDPEEIETALARHA